MRPPSSFLRISLGLLTIGLLTSLFGLSPLRAATLLIGSETLYPTDSAYQAFQPNGHLSGLELRGQYPIWQPIPRLQLEALASYSYFPQDSTALFQNYSSSFRAHKGSAGVLLDLKLPRLTWLTPYLRSEVGWLWGKTEVDINGGGNTTFASWSGVPLWSGAAGAEFRYPLARLGQSSDGKSNVTPWLSSLELGLFFEWGYLLAGKLDSTLNAQASPNEADPIPVAQLNLGEFDLSGLLFRIGGGCWF